MWSFRFRVTEGRVRTLWARVPASFALFVDDVLEGWFGGLEILPLAGLVVPLPGTVSRWPLPSRR
jgi:hypothetical protein